MTAVARAVATARAEMTAIVLSPREPPLAPEGVVALETAPALAAAALRRIDADAELHAAYGDGWLVVLGPAEDLPWADGCVYVGRAGPLLIPPRRRSRRTPSWSRPRWA